MNKDYEYYKHKRVNSLQEILELSIKNGKDDIAFFYNGKDDNIIYKTYYEFYNDVTSLKKYFYKKFKNKHICIIGNNSYDWLVIYLGIVLSGNVAVIIDKDLKEEQIYKMLDKTNTKTIFYSRYCKSIFENNQNKYDKYKIEDIPLYIDEVKEIKTNINLDVNKVCTIFFTSGTTGFNKAVMLSHKNIADNIYGATSLFKLDGNSLSVLPFHHAFGLIIGIFGPFFWHKSVFINESLKNLMADIKISKPQTLIVVPVFIENFYKVILSNAKKNRKKKLLKRIIKISNLSLKMNIDLRSKLFASIISEFGGNLQYIICGGAYLDVKYVKWFRSIGIEVLNGYGITECSPVIAVNRNNYKKDGSVGQVIKGGKVKIVDNEILFKGNSVMLGYYKDTEATDKVLKKGWFYTGDYGYLDDDNFLFITGRKKNLIILSNGENVSPEVIESELLHEEGVCEVIVYAKDNKIMASIYPEEEYIGNQEYFDKLIYKYNKNIPKNRQIAMAILRDKPFIKNSNNKILRNEIER